MRLFLCLAVAFGCGATPMEPASPLEPTSAEHAPMVQAPVESPPAPTTTGSDGTIVRRDLVAVLDGGLGRFLQGVTTEPHLQHGRFVGFRVVRLYPDDPRFASLPLQPGDTVTRINGMSIERPEQALQAWSSLRVASQLLVEYLHDGEPRKLRFDIVD